MVETSTDLATRVVDQLLQLGVEHVVLAPGSRSAPLAFALAKRADAGDLTLHTRIDERTAAFLALGIAKGSHRPAVVVTTSGTAVANLHPAMLEASHAGVPLIALSADRPATLRGTGANQTTDQVRMFGDAATFIDVAAGMNFEPMSWDARSPLHLNVQFTEPLVPTDGSNVRSDGSAGAHPSLLTAEPSVVTGEVRVGPRTVVVAGDDSGRVGRQIAEAGGWPVFAEPSSGSRTGANALRTYRLLLQTAIADEIERVIVTGHPTLSRPVAQLLAREDVEVVSVRAQGRWPQRPFPVAVEVDELTVAGEPEDPAWLDRWREADCDLAGRIDHYVREIPGLSPYEVAAEVAAAIPSGGMLWVGASNPIRDLDLMAPPTPVGDHRMVLANRGLAGIDGTLSTAIGAAIARKPTRAIAYVGDVTFLHDLTALIQGPDELQPDLTIVVANDNGGSIFTTLEQGAPEYASSFERLFATPHGVDLAALCAAVRIPHWRVDRRAELAHALGNANGGLDVIEATIERGDRRLWESDLRGLIR
ncbi:MAG: 2-succinyl-5-enolpyruvyl-6-hydroxy-3-cyclohexene-1-carboxylic-acid synthase [Marmoricola sp.]